MQYTIAININGYEEYLCELSGDDCFTDDIGNAILFDFIEEVPPFYSKNNEYLVKIEDGYIHRL